MSTVPIHFQQVTGLGGPYQTTTRGFSGISPFGTCWFLDTVNGLDGNDGKSAALAKLTLAEVYSRMSAGDSLIIAPGSTITLTAAFSLAKANITIVGIGNINNKPTITVNVAADGLSLDAAGITVDNIAFAAPGTDAATAMINVAAAGCTIKNITGIGSGSSKNFVDCITLASGANDCLINNVELYNTNTPVNSFLSIEAAVARLRVFNLFAFGDCVTAGIIDGATATQIHFFNVVIGTVGTTIAGAILDSNPTGLIENCKFAGTSTTLANNAALGTGVRLFNVWVLEETDGSAQGAQIPAVDVN